MERLCVQPVLPMESAWKRDLQMAKERLKKARLKTATDANLEEKKANLAVLTDDLNTMGDFPRASHPSSREHHVDLR